MTTLHGVMETDDGKLAYAERPAVPHYQAGGIECIDYLRAKLTPDEFRGYLLGNALKYLSRLGHKGQAASDARKAWDYVGWLVEELER